MNIRSTIKNLSLLALTALCFTSHAQTKEELLQSEVNILRVDLKRAQAELAKLREDAKRGRTLPVALGERKAVLGSGQVLQIQNQSTKELPLKVTLISPTFGKTNTFDLVLDGAKILSTAKEIGHKEGWAGAAGDLILIESEGYDPIKKHF